MMNCHEFRPLLETFMDGELDAAQTLQVEAHLDECGRCQEELGFAAAIKHEVRLAVHADSEPSDDFQQRLGLALRAEEQRERDGDTNQKLVPLSWRSIFPLVAAAAALFVYVGTKQNATSSPRGAGSASAEATVANVDFEQALDQLIDNHSSPPRFQVTQPELVTAFEPNVGVRVRLPSLAQYGAQWEGASLVAVSRHSAASLRYRMPGHRVTIYVYDPRKMQVRQHLKPRMLRNKPIYVGQWRGYSVAAKENKGVGYALAADLDDAATAELITAIH